MFVAYNDLYKYVTTNEKNEEKILKIRQCSYKHWQRNVHYVWIRTFTSLLTRWLTFHEWSELIFFLSSYYYDYLKKKLLHDGIYWLTSDTPVVIDMCVFIGIFCIKKISKKRDENRNKCVGGSFTCLFINKRRNFNGKWKIE